MESLPRFGVQGQEWDSSSRYQRTWNKRRRRCRQSAVGDPCSTYLNVVLCTCTMCMECKNTWPSLRLLSFISIVREFCLLLFTPGTWQHILKMLFLLVCVFLFVREMTANRNGYLAETLDDRQPFRPVIIWLHLKWAMFTWSALLTPQLFCVNVLVWTWNKATQRTYQGL